MDGKMKIQVKGVLCALVLAYIISMLLGTHFVAGVVGFIVGGLLQHFGGGYAPFGRRDEKQRGATKVEKKKGTTK